MFFFTIQVTPNILKSMNFHNVHTIPHPNLPPRGKEQSISPLGETGKGVNEIIIYINLLHKY
jgi:hypothetical protein